MNEERRNDIGGKALLAIFGVLIGIIMQITFQTAQAAMVQAQDNRVEIRGNTKSVERLLQDMGEMKSKIDVIYSSIIKK
uniref:Uncharacterized protein n=1 Tax=viral metagenome TaxID=1070528 RepID=A0A6H1ZD94_9ZZZZ